MLPLAHGALGYLDELLPLFLIVGFAIILGVVALLSRKTDNAVTNQTSDHDSNLSNASEVTDQGSVTEHFRLD
jgi:hypothetical protein